MNHNKYFNITIFLAVLWIILFLLLLWFKSYKLEQALFIIVAIGIGWLLYWTYKAVTYKYSEQSINDTELLRTKDTSVNDNQQ